MLTCRNRRTILRCILERSLSSFFGSSRVQTCSPSPVNRRQSMRWLKNVIVSKSATWCQHTVSILFHLPHRNLLHIHHTGDVNCSSYCHDHEYDHYHYGNMKYRDTNSKGFERFPGFAAAAPFLVSDNSATAFPPLCRPPNAPSP